MAAKQNTYGAAVTAYPVDDYKHMRLFLTPDGRAGFALKGDDIVSVFKHPDSTEAKVTVSLLALATQEGGRRLDAFDTQLPTMYSRDGFRAVARLKFSDEHAPEGWDRDTFKEFNGGRPDVVFMIHDPAYGKLYTKGDGATVKRIRRGHDRAGVRARRELATKARWIKASPIKTIDDVKREAPKAQQALVDVGQRDRDQYGLTLKDPGPKTKTAKGVQRVLDKAKERGVNLAAVTDTARMTFLVDHPEQTDQIIAELAQHFDVAPEPWKVTDMNYGDRAVNVRLPNGVIAEVQMLHPDMAWAKSPDGGGGHDLYTISRSTGPKGTNPDPVASMPTRWPSSARYTARFTKACPTTGRPLSASRASRDRRHDTLPHSRGPRPARLLQGPSRARPCHADRPTPRNR